MSLSKSKSKTTSAPAAFAQPYLNSGLSQTQQAYNTNQPQIQGLASIAQQGAQQLSQTAFGASPFVQNAQNAASQTLGGAYLGQNPGASAYSGVRAGQNPATSTLTQLAQGGENPAMAQWQALLGGGNNSAIPGLSAVGYGTGSMGAGDGTIGQIAGNTAVSGADGYDQSVLGGKYLNANPGYAQYMKTLNGDYLDGNPYVDAIAKQGEDAALKAANQKFAAAGLGAGLSSAYTDVATRNVADAGNTVRFNNYNNERTRQLQAGSQADAAFANERGNMESASGRISTNFNAGQDRALTAAQALSNGSRADAGARLAALGQLSGANQQQFANQATAASGLGSAYNQDRANQLTAASTLGSQWNQGQQTQLAAGQAQDAAYSDERTRMMQALGLTGQLNEAQYAGIAPLLQLIQSGAQTPFAGTSAYNSGVGGLTNGYGTNTSTQSQGIGSLLGGVAGAGLAGWAGNGFSLGKK